MSIQFLWSTGLVGGPQKLRKVRKILTLGGSSFNLRLQQLQFTILRMVTGVKVGRLTTFQM